jgi:hypothetical protein
VKTNIFAVGRESKFPPGEIRQKEAIDYPNALEKGMEN